MKICLAGTGAMGVIHVKALRRSTASRSCRSTAATEESGKAFAAEWEIPHSLDESRGMHRSARRRRRDPHDAERACTRTRRCSRLSKGKHVQVEIPMSLNLPDSAAHGGGARSRRGKICMVTHTRRFSAPHREIRRRIQDGTFHLHHMVVETYFFRRDQPQHARPAAVVGRQPALASRLPFGRSRAVDPGRSGLRRSGARKDPITQSSASRWT